jgi:Ran GTPase-activating protein (RanGAP) involved in mRNA processing and transport
MKVNKKMFEKLRTSRIMLSLNRIYKLMKDASYMDLLSNNSNRIENFIANEMNYQINEIALNFDIEDWKKLKEIVIFILTLKLSKEKKINFNNKIEKKTLFYLRETLSMSSSSAKPLSLINNRITKYPSKIISTLLINDKLIELDLTKCIFTKIGFKSFLNIFEKSKYSEMNPLRRLILKRCELGDKRIKDILLAIRNKKNLYYIDLTNNKIQEDPLFILAYCQYEFFISNLKLDFNEISKKGAKLLSNYIQNNKFIRKVSLVSSICNEKCFDYISNSIAYLEEGVSKFTLGLNTFLDPTVKNFLDALKTNNTLRCLKIFFWEFTDRGLEMFFDFLTDKYCKLTKLYFCSVGMGEKTELFQRLIDSLIKNNSIKFLIFSQCDLDSKHAYLIKKLLECNKNLIYIDLRDNFIEEKDKKMLKRYVHQSVNDLELYL